MKPSKSFGNLPTIRKTPGKTLRTPAPPKQVMATPLPSASKPRRSRQSLTPSVPVQFTTPSARNWEEGGSFESVVEGLNELGLGVMEEEEEGVAEVEEMPPRSERESGRQAASRQAQAVRSSDIIQHWLVWFWLVGLKLA
jgi:hypothetical protein